MVSVAAEVLFPRHSMMLLLSKDAQGDVFFARWPAPMSDLNRMSLVEFSKLYLRSRPLPPDDLTRDPPAASSDEDKYAAQVEIAVMKSRTLAQAF
jgi:hypothetical protein